MNERPAWIVPSISTETLITTESAVMYAFHEASSERADMATCVKIANQCRAEIHARAAACDLI